MTNKLTCAAAVVDDILYGHDLGADRRAVDEGMGQGHAGREGRGAQGGRIMNKLDDNRGGIRMRSDQRLRDDAVVDDLIYGRDLGADRQRAAEGRGQGKSTAAIIPGAARDFVHYAVRRVRSHRVLE